MEGEGEKFTSEGNVRQVAGEYEKEKAAGVWDGTKSSHPSGLDPKTAEWLTPEEALHVHKAQQERERRRVYWRNNRSNTKK